MSLSGNDVSLLLTILGQQGALAGLKSSPLKNEDFYKALRNLDVKISKKTRREEMIRLLLVLNSSVANENTEKLLKMNVEQIRSYLEQNNASRDEVVKLMKDFGIEPPKSSKVNIIDFAAQEISDLGMFERISEGR